MKNIICILLVMSMIGIFSCGQKGRSKDKYPVVESSETDTIMKKTSVKFTSVEHDFGQVKEGEKVVHVFEAQNTGKNDLVFQSVRPSCGCTAPKFDTKPIRPGKKGTIEVVFDTKNRPGVQRKTVMVITNTEPPNTLLTFSCEVLPAEKENAK